MSTLAIDADAVRATLELLHPPGTVFEIRALKVANARIGGRFITRRVTVSGYFDSVEKAVSAILDTFGKADCTAIYTTLNGVNPALLARASNRLIQAEEKGGTTGDAHVPRRSRLLFDFDPVRPAGISSTDEEKQAARVLAREVDGFLKARGWPESIAADSGNGFHLLPAVDLPGDDGGLIKRVLEAIAARFNTETVKIDCTVFNPARITKLYGTPARKGDDTADRPHRMSEILRVPEAV